MSSAVLGSIAQNYLFLGDTLATMYYHFWKRFQPADSKLTFYSMP